MDARHEDPRDEAVDALLADAFAPDADDAEARARLAANARLLRDREGATILVEGHCDERGTAQYNMALGWKRANETKRYLVTLGIPENRIETVSYGKERPIAICSEERCYEQNRRAVTVITVGYDESEEVLRREMAMGADNGLLLCDEAFEGSDGKGIATLLKAAVEKGKYDLILTGAQADDGAAEVGGMLAAMLDYPYASLVNKVEVDGDKLKVGREIEGGNQEMNEIQLPCVLSIQTGINEPRYVGIRGIRKVASVEIPEMGAGDLGVDAAAVGAAGAKVKRLDYFVPELGEGAEMLEGSTEEIVAKLIELLKAKGGLK